MLDKLPQVEFTQDGQIEGYSPPWRGRGGLQIV